MKHQNPDYVISYIKRPETPFNMPVRHYHDQFEIYYLLNGERYYFIDNRTYQVKKGDLILIDKNILHKTNTTGKHAHTRILIQLSPGLVEGFNKEINDTDLFYCFQLKQNIYSLDPKEQLWVENHLFKILKEDQQKREGYLTYIKILIIELLIFINRIARSASSLPYTYPDQTHQNMSEVASFIQEHYNKKLSLNNLAKRFNYSPSYLSKAFKEVTGFNLIEYKNNVRVKEASKLLLQSNLSITEIAGLVGYNSLTHFGRIFSKLTGHSPLKYRKMGNRL